MPTTTLRGTRDGLTEVYADVLPILRGIARHTARAYRIDYREALSEVGLHFCECYHTHNPARGEFGKRVRFLVWRRIVGERRRVMRQHRLLPTIAIHEIAEFRQNDERFVPEECVPDTRPDPVDVEAFDPESVQRAETDDGRYLAGLALDPPSDLAERLRTCLTRKARLRRVLVVWLREKGWTAERVQAALKDAAGV